MRARVKVLFCTRSELRKHDVDPGTRFGLVAEVDGAAVILKYLLGERES